MIQNIKSDETLTDLCTDIFKKLQTTDSKQEFVKQLVVLNFDKKMSEIEYVRYQFFKILTEMYAEGFEAGRHYRPVLPEQKRFATLKRNEIPPSFPNRKSAIESFAIDLAPVINEIKLSGSRTLQEIANRLTEMNIQTFSGQNRWHPSSVRRLEAIITKCEIEFKAMPN